MRRTYTKRMQIDLLLPVHIAAVFFGPWLVLQIVSPGWLTFGQYALAFLVFAVTYVLVNINLTVERKRTVTKRG